MKIGNLQINYNKQEPTQGFDNPNIVSKPKSLLSPSSYYEPDIYTYSNPSHLHRQGYDGEKTKGELGIIREYYPMYHSLAARSWQAYLESEIAQIVIENYLLWVIGDGLKLQAEPSKEVLQQEGITIPVDFAKQIEARFKVFAKSRKPDYKADKNLALLDKMILKHALVGGDCLVVLRASADDAYVNVQIIDGQHIHTTTIKDNIRNGIQYDNDGREVAYHVIQRNGDEKIIQRYGKDTGRLQAFMVKGLEYRVDNNRGMPIFSAVLETISKMDRYKEATVGSAEERQKMPWYTKHGVNSTGEDPMKSLRESLGNDTENVDPKIDELLEKTRNDIAFTTGKTVFNMPRDSELASLESKNELYFKEFYETNFVFLCAALMIPPEVALNKYDSNYSSSRAAIKSWEYRIRVARKEFSFAVNQNVYNIFLELQVLKNKVQAPGYIDAMFQNNWWVIEAYRHCRWVGQNVPHIDPLKEVLAARRALGDNETPLTTYEFVAEMLGFGEWDKIIEQVKDERASAPELIKTGDANAKDESAEGLMRTSTT